MNKWKWKIAQLKWKWKIPQCHQQPNTGPLVGDQLTRLCQAICAARPRKSRQLLKGNWSSFLVVLVDTMFADLGNQDKCWRIFENQDLVGTMFAWASTPRMRKQVVGKSASHILSSEKNNSKFTKLWSPERVKRIKEKLFQSRLQVTASAKLLHQGKKQEMWCKGYFMIYFKYKRCLLIVHRMYTVHLDRAGAVNSFISSFPMYCK